MRIGPDQISILTMSRRAGPSAGTRSDRNNAPRHRPGDPGTLQYKTYWTATNEKFPYPFAPAGSHENSSACPKRRLLKTRAADSLRGGCRFELWLYSKTSRGASSGGSYTRASSSPSTSPSPVSFSFLSSSRSLPPLPPPQPRPASRPFSCECLARDALNRMRGDAQAAGRAQAPNAMTALRCLTPQALAKPSLVHTIAETVYRSAPLEGCSPETGLSSPPIDPKPKRSPNETEDGTTNDDIARLAQNGPQREFSLRCPQTQLRGRVGYRNCQPSISKKFVGSEA